MQRENRNGSSSNAHCGIDRLPALHALPEETRHYLHSICAVPHLAANETLAHQGDEVRRVYFVRSGLLRMQKQLADGRTQIVGLLAPEHIAGTVFVGKHAFAIEAAAPSEVISFEARQFRSAVSTTPELEQILVRSFQDEVDASLNWLLLVSCSKVRAKLAGFLLMLLSQYRDTQNSKDKNGGILSLQIPISRIDLSNILGVRPESLSRAFHALADNGRIEIIKPDHVRVLDVEGLSIEVGDPDLFRLDDNQRAGSKAPGSH
jgi:CRP/FNR family transcriptional regulator